MYRGYRDGRSYSTGYVGEVCARVSLFPDCLPRRTLICLERVSRLLTACFRFACNLGPDGVPCHP